MSKLYLLVGIPGCGKTTFAKKHIDEFDTYVSRDEIRFSMLSDGEDYFSHEDAVFRTYVEQISRGLANSSTVWADATHLSVKARLKVLHNLSVKPDEIEIIYFKTPLGTALQQNRNRTGLSKVPDEAIIRMYRNLEEPEFHEGEWTYKRIYIKEPNKILQIREEAK